MREFAPLRKNNINIFDLMCGIRNGGLHIECAHNTYGGADQDGHGTGGTEVETKMWALRKTVLDAHICTL